LLSGGADGGVCVWDLDQLSEATTPLEPVATVPNGPQSHKFGISSIIYYPSDPGLFVTASYDKSVKVWDANEMKIAFTFNLGMVPHSIAMGPRAYHTLVAVSSASPTIRLLDLDSGGATHSLVCGGTFAINWSPHDEYLLASGGIDGTVRLWDIRMAASCIACLDMNNSGRERLDERNRAHEGKPTSTFFATTNG
jgi:DNA excision repair protein ERCC-8